MANMRWFAIHTHCHHEFKVAGLLQRHGFESFLPTYHDVRRWRNRQLKQLELPLFPCYLFLRTQEQVPLVSHFASVLTVVGNSSGPCLVPDDQIDHIRKCVAQYNAQPHSYVVAGDRARIRSGPLAGMEGIVVEIRGSWRVVINVELLMRAMSIEVEIDNLEKLSVQTAICRAGAKAAALAPA